MSIQLLDEQTINKIAAGEVIDRPASILKELVDNSLDAGSSHIVIELEQGGIRQIKLTDNGRGMSPEDLVKSPLRHATSKIHTLDDIYTTTTLGFRGEALASIAHIASLRIQSRLKASDLAYEIVATDGQLSTPKGVSHRPGTTVIVQDVFYRVPVRRQYLKSPGTEYSHCYQTLLPFVFFFPHVDFVLIHNGEEVFSTVGCSTQAQLLQLIFGRTLQDKLLTIDQTFRGVRVTGCVSDPTLTYSNRAKQFYGVNSRSIQSSILQKIVNDVYRDLIPARRFPLILLNVELDTSTIDVNIHPKKLDVKFLHADLLFSTIPKILKQAFNYEHTVLSSTDVSNAAPFSSMSPMMMASSDGAVVEVSESSLPAIQETIQETPLFETDALYALNNDDFEFFQIFETYLVVKARSELWLLDQHAVHERILYERFKSQLDKDNYDVSPLLLGEVVDVTPDLMVVFSELSEWFSSMSFHIEEFGKDQLIIRQIPAHFSGCRIQEWLTYVLEDFKQMGQTGEQVDLKERLQLRACKAAIKAGKRLSECEVIQLLKDFTAAPSNFTCPHGRPLFVSFSKADLEKLFLRR